MDFWFNRLEFEMPKKFVDYLRKIFPKNTMVDIQIMLKMEGIYNDVKELNLDDRFMYYLTYLIIKLRYDIMDVPLEKHFKYFDLILENPELKKKIPEGNWQSEYFSVLKVMIPHFDELTRLISSNKSYAVIKKQKEIIDILNKEAMPELNEEELYNEIDKRYYYPLSFYKCRMKKRKYQEDYKKNRPWDQLKMSNGSITCTYLLEYLHDKMVKYYTKTRYIYRPLNNDIDIYFLGEVALLTYHTDDVLGLSVEDLGRKYKWQNYEFWGLINDPNMRKRIKFQYLNLEHKFPFDDIDVIVAPTKYMDEAFLAYVRSINGMMHDDKFNFIVDDLLNRIGFPIDTMVSGDLMTQDNLVYFKNPWNVDILEVKDINNFETLKKIKAKNLEERKKYLSKLVSTYRGRKTRLDKIDKLKPVVYTKRKPEDKQWLD